MFETPSPANAALILCRAILGSFRSMEILVTGAMLLGVVGIAYTTSLGLKLLAISVLLFGGATLYYAMRMRIECRIFGHWDALDPSQFDAQLLKLNPTFKVGRSLEATDRLP